MRIYFDLVAGSRHSGSPLIWKLVAFRELGKILREKGYENRIDTPEVHKKKMEMMFAKFKEDAQSEKWAYARSARVTLLTSLPGPFGTSPKSKSGVPRKETGSLILHSFPSKIKQTIFVAQSIPFVRFIINQNHR